MSSAESGVAPPCARPMSRAGSPSWASTPSERAERDGIASWDLVLDGRRRFDLRVTVILDPALAVICWAHYAPPINDMFRKSYRKLLRWNDEFPFAKFSVGEDERPLLAVELPIDDRRAPTQLGLALARILGIADQLLEESKDWLWIGGRIPDQGGRTLGQRRAPRSLRGAPPRAAGRRRRHDRRAARRAASAGSGLAVALAAGCWPRPARRAGRPRRRAGPDDRRATPRYDVQPDAAPRPGHRRPGR